VRRRRSLSSAERVSADSRPRLRDGYATLRSRRRETAPIIVFGGASQRGLTSAATGRLRDGYAKSLRRVPPIHRQNNPGQPFRLWRQQEPDGIGGVFRLAESERMPTLDRLHLLDSQEREHL